MSLLLDTCGLLALQNGGREFSKGTRKRLEAPGSEVWISAISAFEIAQKHAAGKLMLPGAPDQWFHAMLRHHQVVEIPVSSHIGIGAALLPKVHRDPFDRIIIATAMERGLEVVTADRMFTNYPGIATLW